MSVRRMDLAVVALATALLVPSLMAGAATSGIAFTGRVIDAHGAPLPGARVTAFRRVFAHARGGRDAASGRGATGGSRSPSSRADTSST